MGREFADGKDDSLYAATPPLEALRVVVSHGSTDLVDEEGRGCEVMVNDVSRAYFYAPARRSLFIKLPEEDLEAQPGQVGRLNVS